MEVKQYIKGTEMLALAECATQWLSTQHEIHPSTAKENLLINNYMLKK